MLDFFAAFELAIIIATIIGGSAAIIYCFAVIGQRVALAVAEREMRRDADSTDAEP